MTDQINIILLALGSAQGLLVSFFIVAKSKSRRPNIYLSLFLLTVGLQLTFKLLSKTWLMDHVLVGYALSYHLPLAAIPLLYLYIKSRASSSAFANSDLLHFIPFAIGITHQFLYVVIHDAYGAIMPAWTFNAPERAIIQIVSLVAYTILSFNLIRKSLSDNIKTGLRRFVSVVSVSEFLVIVALALKVLYYNELPDVKLLFIALTISVYWVTYNLMSQPSLLITTAETNVVALKISSRSKYAHSGLKQENADHIASLLSDSMTIEKPYLQPDLTLDSLALKLDIPKHHLSQVLNERFSQTYTEFIGTKRVEEAASRLLENKYAHYSIAAIAFDSGFTSLSNFNDLFRKRYGIPPSTFRKQKSGEKTA